MQQTPIDGFLSTLHVCHSRIYFTLEQISRNALCCFYSTTSKKYYFYNKILWSTRTSSRRGNQLQLGRDPSNLKTTSGSNWANWQSLRIAWVWYRVMTFEVHKRCRNWYIVDLYNCLRNFIFLHFYFEGRWWHFGIGLKLFICLQVICFLVILTGVLNLYMYRPSSILNS